MLEVSSFVLFFDLLSIIGPVQHTEAVRCWMTQNLLFVQ